jgi:hypothetical protein
MNALLPALHKRRASAQKQRLRGDAIAAR